MQQFKHPEKWRETVDLFSLKYHSFKPTEILGYPAARNDVFYVKGLYEGKEITAYVKSARHKDSAIENEVEIMRQIDMPFIPKILDVDFSEPAFSVTEDMPGLRLSYILGENENMASLEYMEEYGETLAKLHKMKVESGAAADRKFHHAPPYELLEKLDLLYLEPFFANAPKDIKTVFCHGDFHYANILWKNKHISAILDFELSGYGNRDFDIAWALFLRPGQRFLRTKEERELFLKGYSKHGDYNEENIIYYMAQSYVYFLDFCTDDEYGEYMHSWLRENCR